MLIPSLLMLVLVIGHTIAIQFMQKKRKSLDVTTQEGQAKDKQFKLIITILYVEIPLITAIIWFVVAPMFATPAA